MSKINAIYSTPYEGNTSVSNGTFKGNHILPISGSLSGSKSGSGAVKTIDYGMNIFESINEGETDYCLLPSSNKVGDSIYIVNKGNDILKLEQAETHQSILIPPDGNLYRTINMGSGAWTPVILSTPINFTSYELIVNHVSGSNSDAYIGMRTISGSGTTGCGNVNGTLVLTPSASYWNTVRGKRTWATRLTVTSNISSSDMAMDPYGWVLNNDTIRGSVRTAYLPSYNTAAATTIADVIFGDTISGYYNCQASTAASPYAGNIGDNGTLYGLENTIMVATPSNATLCEIGKRSVGSGSITEHWFIFTAHIPASAKTKTYKFQYYLDGFYI